MASSETESIGCPHRDGYRARLQLRRGKRTGALRIYLVVVFRADGDPVSTRPVLLERGSADEETALRARAKAKLALARELLRYLNVGLSAIGLDFLLELLRLPALAPPEGLMYLASRRPKGPVAHCFYDERNGTYYRVVEDVATFHEQLNLGL
jgi:hypothetical protein